jgi:hypothetical protein
LIDQVRNEVKDAYKKLENLRVIKDAELKKLHATISDIQQNFHEKNAELKLAVDQKSRGCNREPSKFPPTFEQYVLQKVSDSTALGVQCKNP